jgi:hypothetical protein
LADSSSKSSVVQPLLDQGLRFFHGQVSDVYVIDERKINIAGIADSCFGRKLGDVVYAHLNQIACAQP